MAACNPANTPANTDTPATTKPTTFNTPPEEIFRASSAVFTTPIAPETAIKPTVRTPAAVAATVIPCASAACSDANAVRLSNPAESSPFNPVTAGVSVSVSRPLALRFNCSKEVPISA